MLQLDCERRKCPGNALRIGGMLCLRAACAVWQWGWHWPRMMLLALYDADRAASGMLTLPQNPTSRQKLHRPHSQHAHRQVP